ncbi:hypothetical protein WN944_006275 [Citrus x changshan-huyou]|uniref:F-box domain-containing protein n=1 Tax=Citrus x changshan-huyou TaxID=2935761 RepID=A0AAP0MLI2_9ROSI
MNGDVHEGCNKPKFVFVLLFLLMQSPFRFLGSEAIVDDVQDSVPVDSGTNNMSSYGQKTKPGRQRLKRKEYIWPGSEVIGESGSILTYQKKKLEDLPAKCISRIISLTTPRDASRLALVCPAFRSAADSDSVWEKFLPSDYEGFISNSSLIDRKKKDLYFHLCRNPILFDNNTASFGLEQESGKKCYMAGAKWIYENSGISHRDCEMIPSSAGSSCTSNGVRILTKSMMPLLNHPKSQVIFLKSANIHEVPMESLFVFFYFYLFFIDLVGIRVGENNGRGKEIAELQRGIV